MGMGIKSLIGSGVRRSIMTHLNILDDIRLPARYACQAFFRDRLMEDFWSDDLAEVLARFEAQAAGDAECVSVVDYVADDTLKLYWSETARSHADITRASDEALERAIDELHARGG
jgi:hypothetical protein